MAQVLPQTELGTQQAQEFLKQAKELQTEWATLGAQSLKLLQEFRERGAPLTERFTDRYEELNNRRLALLDTVNQAASGWDLMWIGLGPEVPLSEFVEELGQLVHQCEERDRERIRRAEHFENVVRLVKSIDCVDGEVTLELTQFACELERQLPQGDEIPLLSGELQESSEAALALLQLVVDGCDRLANRGSLSNTDCVRHFETVVTYGTVPVGIAALRGELTLETVQLEESRRILNGASEGLSPEDWGRLSTSFGITDSEPIREAPESQPTHDNKAAPLAHVVDVAQGLCDSARQEFDPNNPPLDGLASRTQIRAAGHYALGRATLVATEIMSGVSRMEPERYRTLLPGALNLVAEAQNSVRVQFTRSGEKTLQAQDEIFHWLNAITNEDAEDVHIEKYMRRDQVAEPKNNFNLVERIRTFSDRWQQETQANELCDQLARQAAAIVSGNDRRAAWQEISVLVTQLIQCGRKNSDVQIRGHLLPVIETLFDQDEQPVIDPSEELDDVLEEIQRFRILEAAHAASQEKETAEPIPEVVECQQFLSGRVLALVGGIAKPPVIARIKKAFDLKDLIWIQATKHDRVKRMQPDVRKSNLVILLTSLIGHKHNDVRPMCEQLGIPYVNMKHRSGFGVNTLAHSILEQASDQL